MPSPAPALVWRQAARSALGLARSVSMSAAAAPSPSASWRAFHAGAAASAAAAGSSRATRDPLLDAYKVATATRGVAVPRGPVRPPVAIDAAAAPVLDAFLPLAVQGELAGMQRPAGSVFALDPSFVARMPSTTYPTRVAKACQVTPHPAFVLQPQTAALMAALTAAENAAAAAKGARYVLTGRAGSGKSTALLQLAEYLHRRDWLVLYVPRPAHWVGGFDAFEPETDPARPDAPPRRFLQPDLAVRMLAQQLALNGAALADLRVPGHASTTFGQEIQRMVAALSSSANKNAAAAVAGPSKAAAAATAAAGAGAAAITPNQLWKALLDHVAGGHAAQPAALLVDSVNALFPLSEYKDATGRRLLGTELALVDDLVNALVPDKAAAATSRTVRGAGVVHRVVAVDASEATRAVVGMDAVWRALPAAPLDVAAVVAPEATPSWTPPASAAAPPFVLPEGVAPEDLQPGRVDLPVALQNQLPQFAAHPALARFWNADAAAAADATYSQIEMQGYSRPELAAVMNYYTQAKLYWPPTDLHHNPEKSLDRRYFVTGGNPADVLASCL
ncbi:hypothetical protein CXG81DRAFT_26587 [Caulochytrium protostelioides]|uniref:Small ribosomal subunit protein mS29 n=1 Tax=Caulochytrium protostelioides TaxID=1555241 RepID=A0A4V1IUI9_9FUNG|nr:hypothetical protein CXG81DRAFT_26587 [Caulochytrium protostelioides]|eukprot:RKP00719.1 hypothetical protein CXG81DRAFT_26587 [Caulochytrium protostelioides]